MTSLSSRGVVPFHWTTSNGSKQGIFRLSHELIRLITSFCANRDIKNLRLACRFLLTSAELRLRRVYVSSNPRDVEVLTAIANHETFRHKVVEIVWDETFMGFNVEDIDQCPPWFRQRCLMNRLAFRNHHGCKYLGCDRGHDLLEGEMSVDESWVQFKHVARLHKEVTATNTDVEAFRYALARFPSLHTVTITDSAHGPFLLKTSSAHADVPWTTSYETPGMRALRPGFNYPIAGGWTLENYSVDEYLRGLVFPPDRPRIVVTVGAEPDPDAMNSSNPPPIRKHRGFLCALRVLAESEGIHQISNLILDAQSLPAGIDMDFLTNSFSFHISIPTANMLVMYVGPPPGQAQVYQDLRSLINRPGFRRLDLALAVDPSGWPGHFPLFKDAANGHESDLQHLSLTANISMSERAWPGPTDCHEAVIYPVEKIMLCADLETRWPKLRHFGLSGAVVMSTGLMTTLESLPSSLRSLELRDVYPMTMNASHRCVREHWASFLSSMRDTLEWRSRPAAERPVVTIHFSDQLEHPRFVVGPGNLTFVDPSDFLYRDGENPF